MIWKPCTLQEKRKIGEDELKNPVYEYVNIQRTSARVTPWTDEEIVLLGRDVTRNEQRLLIPVPFSQFLKCDRVVFDGKVQEIKNKIDLSPRYTMLQVTVYKE